jgi:hypothetical protein
VQFIIAVWFAIVALFQVPSQAFAAWTPMITSSMFDGIMADVQTTAGGIVSVLLIIVGLSLLVRAFSR